MRQISTVNVIKKSKVKIRQSNLARNLSSQQSFQNTKKTHVNDKVILSNSNFKYFQFCQRTLSLPRLIHKNPESMIMPPKNPESMIMKLNLKRLYRLIHPPKNPESMIVQLNFKQLYLWQGTLSLPDFSTHRKKVEVNHRTTQIQPKGNTQNQAKISLGGQTIYQRLNPLFKKTKSIIQKRSNRMLQTKSILKNPLKVKIVKIQNIKLFQIHLDTLQYSQKKSTIIRIKRLNKSNKIMEKVTKIQTHFTSKIEAVFLFLYILSGKKKYTLPRITYYSNCIFKQAYIFSVFLKLKYSKKARIPAFFSLLFLVLIQLKRIYFQSCD
eukprot:TRINITY_DN4126_c1_g1_i7.p1 TRINITY_DN4126_c1_g1~~TRINITY_DN4126_c1_g1_i7.p1  ORF type:complete len:324 (+),score=-26.94 TRINITY_DN4126_c1_g1_i7:245-1216(+)